MPIHNRFDVALWSQRFSLDRLRAKAAAHVRAAREKGGNKQPDPEANEEWIRLMAFQCSEIDGPKTLAVLEQLRRNPPRPLPLTAVPVDVFVWALGEPTNRAVTKVAGLPYRPASTPWPTTSKGQPMDFLAQLCFADSQDLVEISGSPGRLPGDVLLIFCRGERWTYWPDEPGSIRFEWQTLGLTDLCRADQIPPRCWPITPTFAEIHRTMDYADPDEPPALEESSFLNSTNDENSILITRASKIGGLPFWSQGDPRLPGKHLCTLGSLNPFGEDWPLLNVEKNPNEEGYLDNECLMFGDVGEMNISIDDRGELHWNIDCG